MYRSSLMRASIALCGLFSVVAAHAQPVPFAKDPFTDVPKNHANYEAIDHLRTQNVLKGYPDGTFKPEKKLVRAEFVSILTNPFFLSGKRGVNCLNENYGPNAPRVFFNDVPRDSWYAQDVCEATTHQFVSGYPDGTFKPQHYIIFAEAAKVAARVLALNVKPTDAADAKWFEVYVRHLADVKAIPRTIRRFDQEITRGEMAEILFRLKTGNAKKASMTYAELR